MMKREQWVDIGKGIAIILMVLGHSSLPAFVSRFIWAFHMPFFFLVSGWVTNWENRSFKEFCFTRTSKLIVPFIVYSVIVLLMFSLIGESKWQSLINNGWGGYALWFVPVIFVASVIAKFIMSQKRFSPIWAIVLLICIGATLSYLRIDLPWAVNSMPYATSLILIGSYMSQCKKFETKKNQYYWGEAVITFFVTMIVSHFWGLDMACNHITPVIPVTIGAISGFLMIMSFSKLLEKYSSVLSNVLSAIGKETYVIMAFSQIIIICLKQYTSWGGLIRYSLLIVILILIVLLKNGFNRLIGKKIL